MKTTGLNFIEAVQAAKEGYRIKRPCFGDDTYSGYDGVLELDDEYRDASKSDTISLIDDLLADDWIAVKEEHQ